MENIDIFTNGMHLLLGDQVSTNSIQPLSGPSTPEFGHITVPKHLLIEISHIFRKLKRDSRGIFRDEKPLLLLPGASQLRCFVIAALTKSPESSFCNCPVPKNFNKARGSMTRILPVFNLYKVPQHPNSNTFPSP